MMTVLFCVALLVVAYAVAPFAITAFRYDAEISVTQGIETNATLFSDASVKHGSTTVVAVTTGLTKGASFIQALTDAAATIDLTALPGVNGLAVDGTGLRVQYAKFVNPTTNANPITIAIGASNGYDGFGAAFSHTLAPGAELTVKTADAGSDIAAGKKTLDLAGTGVQPLTCVIVVG